MFLSRCRKPVDTFAPRLGLLYRSLRDVSTSQQSRPTIYGFTLAGGPSMAKSNFETEEIGVFLNLIDHHDALIDVGANVGFYSCLAASHGKHVLSFEPSDRNLKFLYRNLWENGFTSAEVFPVGLAKQRGLSCIYGFGGIASFVPGWAQAQKSRFSIVPVTTLDTVVASRFHGQKLFVKVDVEGFEFDVVSGALETLRLEPRPTWLIEIILRHEVVPGGVNTRFADTFKLFWECGYQCRKLDSHSTPVSPEDVSRWVANNFVDSGTQNFLFFE